ncbi:hypothetical protein Gohar_025675 [Gossypium harknessii]|uniref:Uncharacterized protein n=1 Tax=Gossypium harknessii TaxID=34285 RepID=A0A7J9I794_9ROSI|nr:hypothetical protein [Gossypium harknessii]
MFSKTFAPLATYLEKDWPKIYVSLNSTGSQFFRTSVPKT